MPRQSEFWASLINARPFGRGRAQLLIGLFESCIVCTPVLKLNLNFSSAIFFSPSEEQSRQSLRNRVIVDTLEKKQKCLLGDVDVDTMEREKSLHLQSWLKSHGVKFGRWCC